MNILHVIPGDLWAGAEAQVYYTVSALSTFPQHQIRVIVFNRGELYNRLLDIDANVTLLDESCLGNGSICSRLKQEVIEYDVNIVHVHEYKSHILTICSRLMARNNKCVLFRTLHGQNIPSGLKSYLVIGCQEFCLRYMTDHLIAVSGEMKELHLRKSTRAGIHLIYNAVEARTIPPESEVLKVRQRYGLAENQFWIGTAARLERVKNLHMLIEAVRILKNEYPEINFRVSIFGEGSYREVLKSQILQHGLSECVFLEGHNNSIMSVLGALDVFTLTSIHEGLPMSLLEAMSVGTIPVCTSVGGMKEVISHGEDGFLIGSGNTKELADILAYICIEQSNLNLVRLKAHEKVNTMFSVGQACKKLLTLYESTLQTSI